LTLSSVAASCAGQTTDCTAWILNIVSESVVPSGWLFDAEVPEGSHYRPDFISSEEEADLVNDISRVEFSTFRCAGSWHAGASPVRGDVHSLSQCTGASFLYTSSSRS
jgi:hypothetical protein